MRLSRHSVEIQAKLRRKQGEIEYQGRLLQYCVESEAILKVLNCGDIVQRGCDGLNRYGL